MTPTEAAKIRDEYRKLRPGRARRSDLLAFATRWCFPLSECLSDDERAAMTVNEIRFELDLQMDVGIDRALDAYNSQF